MFQAPEPVTGCQETEERDAKMRKTGLEAEGVMEEDLQGMGGKTQTLVLKALLHQGFMIREIHAAIMSVFLGDMSMALLTSMRSTGRWYSQQVQGNKGHALGPPLPHVVITLLKYAVKTAGPTEH